MELTTTNTITPHEVKEGHEQFVISYGKILKIETSPGGAEVLDVPVPEGKQWQVSISVHVKETNL